LIDSFETQGISGAKFIEIQEASDPGRRGFLVKNWSFTDPGSSPGTAPYVYKIGTDANDMIGVAGQGNANPPPAFLNHFIVEYGGQYYDPSYGTGPFADQSAWENASLDGFVDNSGALNNIHLAKKNDPAMIETLFIPSQ
jgi:hypothetical protein